MRIPVAQRTTQAVGLTNAPKLQQMNVPTSAAMFGAQRAQDLSKLAKGLMDVSNTVEYIGNDMMNAEAKEASNKLTQDFAAWQSEQKKKRGKDGMHSEADYHAWYKAKQAELTADMGDVVKGRFLQAADMQNAAYGRWASDYGYGEMVRYEVSTQEAVMATETNMLAENIDNPELAQQSIDKITAAGLEMARLQGWGTEATQEYIRSNREKALIPAIEMRIAEGKLGLARGLLKQYGADIGGKAEAVLSKQISNEAKRQAAEARAAAAEAKSKKFQADMVYAVNTFAGDESGLNAWLKEQYPDNFSAQNSIYSAVQTQNNRNEAIEAETVTREMYHTHGDNLTALREDVQKRYPEDFAMQERIVAGVARQQNLDASAQKQEQERVVAAETQNLYAQANGELTAQEATNIRASIRSPENVKYWDALMERKFAPANEVLYSDESVLQQATSSVINGKIKTKEDLNRVYGAYLSTEDLQNLNDSIQKQKDAVDQGSLRPSFKVALAENFDVEKLATASGKMTPTQYEQMLWNNFEVFYRDNYTRYATKQEAMNDFLRKTAMQGEAFIGSNSYSIPYGGAGALQRAKSESLMGEEVLFVEPPRPAGLPQEAKFDPTTGKYTINGKTIRLIQ